MSDREPGDPAGLPGADAPGEEWDAAGAPDRTFPQAEAPRPAPAPVKSFTWFVVGLLGAGVVLIVIAMVGNVLRLFG